MLRKVIFGFLLLLKLEKLNTMKLSINCREKPI